MHVNENEREGERRRESMCLKGNKERPEIKKKQESMLHFLHLAALCHRTAHGVVPAQLPLNVREVKQKFPPCWLTFLNAAHLITCLRSGWGIHIVITTRCKVNVKRAYWSFLHNKGSCLQWAEFILLVSLRLCLNSNPVTCKKTEEANYRV